MGSVPAVNDRWEQNAMHVLGQLGRPRRRVRGNRVHLNPRVRVALAVGFYDLLDPREVSDVERGQLVARLDNCRCDERVAKLNVVRASEFRQLIPGKIAGWGFDGQYRQRLE